jgi:hypothetical protein
MADPIWNPTANQPYSFMLPKNDTTAMPFTTVPTNVKTPEVIPPANNKWMGIVLLGAALFGASYFMGAFEGSPKKRKKRRKARATMSRKTTRKLTRRKSRKVRGRVTGHI